MREDRGKQLRRLIWRERLRRAGPVAGLALALVVALGLIVVPGDVDPSVPTGYELGTVVERRQKLGSFSPDYSYLVIRRHPAAAAFPSTPPGGVAPRGGPHKTSRIALPARMAPGAAIG